MINWEPKSQMQKEFITSQAEICCGGGSAGCYKTESLLVDAVHEYDNPHFNGILFRSSFPELMGKIVPRSRDLYSQLGGTYNSTNCYWHWPWGAKMQFAYLSRDADVYPHQSSEYSWIGFDESTHRPEFQVRYLLSRLRSTDPTLFRRARFATNPGGPGHAFHQHVFLGGVCPHCEPPVRLPNVIYKDATWDSDKQSIGMSTQFIFGKWDPRGLLPDYDRQLRMQQGGIAKALLEGCWRSFKGQYYDIWEPGRADAPMVVRRQSIGEQWWWPFWVGCDYGFSGSAAAAYLFTRGPAELPRWPRGRIYCLQEYISHREDVRTFARSVYELFVSKKQNEEQPRRMQAMYLSPDSWNDRGDLHTLAGQMNEVLEEHKLEFEKADNDRAGGAQLIYTMLQSGELAIADCCHKLIRSIESRIHDKKEPEKVQKIVGDELDDAYDGFRYGLYSYANTARKPTDIRIQERLDQMFGHDPTRAMMEAEMIRQQQKNSEAGQVYAGNARRRMAEIERSSRR